MAPVLGARHALCGAVPRKAADMTDQIPQGDSRRNMLVVWSVQLVHGYVYKFSPVVLFIFSSRFARSRVSTLVQAGGYGNDMAMDHKATDDEIAMRHLLDRPLRGDGCRHRRHQVRC